MRTVVFLAFALLSTSCETLEFYRQAAVGQWSVMSRRESTTKLIASPRTDPALKARLELVSQVLAFAHDQLALEPRGRYASYVRVHGEYVVWNVFATPEFSTHATRWCYPIVGCAAYRGYFDPADARRYARNLLARQHDVVVGGVPAYSTLGWFDDPLLSTFIDWPDPDLAGLLFHELAHARVFVADDTAFDEAFATFVERRGVLQWLHSLGRTEVAQQLESRWATSDRFVAYLLAWRDELERLYEQPYDAMAMRLLKSTLFEEMERCYRAHRTELGDQEGFFRSTQNNARLVPYVAYNALVPAFAELFSRADESWPVFYERVRAIGQARAEERRARLAALAQANRAALALQPVACEALQY